MLLDFVPGSVAWGVEARHSGLRTESEQKQVLGGVAAMRKGLSGPAGTSPCTRGHVLGPGSPSGPQCHAAFCVPPLPSRDHLHCCPTLSQTPPCRLPRRLCPLETTHGPVALPAPGLPLLRAVWGPSCCQEGCEHHTCSSRGWEPGHHLPVSPRRFRESSGCLGCSTASSPRDTGQSPSLAPQCREGPRERAAPWVQRAPGRPCHPLTSHLSPPPAGMLMVCIVIGARKLGLNPDNIATPIAASLGDLITLSILALVSSFFHKHRDSRYLTPLVCIGFTALTPPCILIAKQNPPVVKILKFGWFPIILAMLVSSFGGLILNKTISKQQFRGMAVFAPIICGVGGNLVAIQTSRISTYLHLWSTPGVLPLWMKKRWPNPRSTFCSSEINSTSARVLLFLVVPGHLIFFSIIYLVEGQSVPNDTTFVGLYLVAGLVQVAILLYLAEAMVRLTWNRALDPDDHCIPYLTGLGDLLGTGLLALCFLAHWLLRSETALDGTSEPASGPS
ncbi:solute carrier family 41 member 3 isoform X1 [Neophocaena asiaeorientalis asiaeorientalis]|uniref:Solute carrier family 41 member n=1 Tax=Neophocaena asiaeorientalis asiaeorientalis TaxID=1706337 RepID=A0A341CWN4_NEOAA|nr:solute carrier family 41 member 3 isoform X1 [Neophocaena asiaeorientalis asiaeorientalis]